MIRFQEQIYDTNRNYYHGVVSKEIFDTPEPRKGAFSEYGEPNLIWLTTNVLYALDYTGFPNNYYDEARVYICKLKKSRIFNAQCDSDIRLIRRTWFEKYHEQLTEEDLDIMLTGDWINTGKRRTLIQCINHRQFDGLFNWENGETYAPSVGVFSNDCIEVKEIVWSRDFDKKFKKQIEAGNTRAKKGLLNDFSVSKELSRKLHITENMLKNQYVKMLDEPEDF
jgi:hypothetical protein